MSAPSHKYFWIVNGESSLIVGNVFAYGERDALNRWLSRNGIEDERIVQCGRQRPYITGDHGACYIAQEARA